VITKGAGRIAEVGARFTLDAMPGKQMAIDADLNAGLIGEDEARRRRTEVGQESEFYGAMDGASKYVRGDAVAGILIIIINIVGGLIVGMVQHDMNFGDAVANYTLLAIGDGLVAQIPSLVISIAAGVVVSRVANSEDIGGQLISQLFTNPSVIYVTAAIIGGIGIIPGMPHFAFMLLGGVLAGIAYTVSQNKIKAKTLAETTIENKPEVTSETEDASWDDVVPVDIVGLEVGYRLIPLVDNAQGGDLLKRIKGIRKKFAQEVGFLAPTVHIRDNLELRPNHYRITLKGVEVANGESNFAQFLAIDPGTVTGALEGAMTTDPAFGLPAVWVDASSKDHAQALGYTVVDAGTVIATHLNHMISMHAAELLGRDEVQKLLDHLGKESPKLIEELIPKLISVAMVQKVLQNLLAEGVHIRDMRTILETLSEHIQETQDANELTAFVRVRLGRAIVQDLFPVGNEVTAMTLDSKLESILLQAVQNNNNTAIEPGIAETLSRQAEAMAKQHEQMGLTPVLLVPAPLRIALSKFLRRSVPHLRVLSHEELPDSKTIRVTSLIGGQA
jgi:flagellar biosynthesis protein FlhA